MCPWHWEPWDWLCGNSPSILFLMVNKEKDQRVLFSKDRRKLISKSKVHVTQTLCDPMDNTVHGILQARILEWVAFPFSRGIFPTQELNPGFPHCRRILYQLSYQGSPSSSQSPRSLLNSRRKVSTSALLYWEPCDTPVTERMFSYWGKGLPRWLTSKESTWQAGDGGWIPGFLTLVGQKVPLEKEGATHSIFLPGKAHG